MKPINIHIHGKLFTGDGRTALLLLNDQPQSPDDHSLYLRLPFVRQGVETRFFPAFILDDWGGEIRSRRVYQWVRDFGEQFPRAEIFGFDAHGRQQQSFVREIDLYQRLPLLAYRQKANPITDGIEIEAVLLPDETIQAPRRLQRPSHLKRPLAAAKVSWWQVNPALTDWPFSPL